MAPTKRRFWAAAGMKRPETAGRFAAALFFAAVLFFAAAAVSAEDAGEAAPETRRLDTIRYGTDTEIAALIKTLRSEQFPGAGPAPGEPAGDPVQPKDAVDLELAALAGTTRNKNILTAVFGFFAERGMTGLEERAARAVEERDDEAFESVLAAIDYIGKLRSPAAGGALREILSNEESRFLNASIRALGRTAKKNGGDETAEFLVDYYTGKDPGDENRRELIIALGAAGSQSAVPFLSSIAENEDERAPLRMAALESLSGLKGGLDAIIRAAGSGDPNVRSSAIAALGPFGGEQTEAAILEAFRDSYYRTRAAAARAARERGLAAALPYLIFRAENDEVPAVRDEAVKALGALGGGAEAREALYKLFAERKNSDRLRVIAAETLLTCDASGAENVIVELDYAKTKNQTALYNGFLRVLAAAKAPALEELARRFFASGGAAEQSAALDICRNNGFRSLETEIRSLAESKNTGLSSKSRRILESWAAP